MKVDAQNYELMRSWFARVVSEALPASTRTAENDPVHCLDIMAARWPAKARSGLAMAIGDMIELTDDCSADRVATIDDALAQEDLPTLTQMRLQFSKVIRRVVGRGSIRNDVEYYAVRNVVELAPPDDQEAMWKLLAAYEQRA